MARSEYIYVVTMHGVVSATFTVKRECLAWLRKEDYPEFYEVWRYGDGWNGASYIGGGDQVLAAQ